MDIIKAKTFSNSLFSLKGISKQTIEEHLKLYQGYVKKTNEIIEKLQNVDLASANQVYSDVRELKIEFSFALGGVRNHEIYFGHLGNSSGQKPNGKLLKLIERDFGSYEKWVDDFKATGMAARGWAWLAYNWDFGKLFNFIGDSQNTYPIWNSTVLLALDTYEHAYFIDYGTDRKSYLEAFLNNLNWEIITRNTENMLKLI